MTREKACEMRDRALSSYDLALAKREDAAMRADRDKLASDYDEWIAANFG